MKEVENAGATKQDVERGYSLPLKPKTEDEKFQDMMDSMFEEPEKVGGFINRDFYAGGGEYED